MLNEKQKNKETKVKMTVGHKKLMRNFYLVATSIVALGILLSALDWAGYL